MMVGLSNVPKSPLHFAQGSLLAHSRIFSFLLCFSKAFRFKKRNSPSARQTPVLASFLSPTLFYFPRCGWDSFLTKSVDNAFRLIAVFSV